MRCRQLGIQGFVLKPKGGGLRFRWFERNLTKKGNPNRDEFLGRLLDSSKTQERFSMICWSKLQMPLPQFKIWARNETAGQCSEHVILSFGIEHSSECKKSTKTWSRIVPKSCHKRNLHPQKNRHWRWVKDGKGDLWVVYLEVQDT